jgi:hypothetical protein
MGGSAASFIYGSGVHAGKTLDRHGMRWTDGWAAGVGCGPANRAGPLGFGEVAAACWVVS